MTKATLFDSYASSNKETVNYVADCNVVDLFPLPHLQTEQPACQQAEIGEKTGRYTQDKLLHFIQIKNVPKTPDPFSYNWP